MSKTILITGSTDGIGLLTAKMLAADGHTALLHGRSESKLEVAAAEIAGNIETYKADLSSMKDVKAFAAAVMQKHHHIDVLINNAGVFKVPNPQTADGYDMRMIVNTVAPYLLTKLLMPVMTSNSRVVNLSSAAQAPVEHMAFEPNADLGDGEAYAQSKLAITMWSKHMADQLGSDGPSIIAVNPASFLGSKMVKEAYGTQGNDMSIGANILMRAALDDEFADASGRYFDNDRGSFANPHPDALDPTKNAAVVEAIEELLPKLS
ncbi:MAG: SDR family NAD(P)-dependent oxidoreductase [Pseudomonadota bacterium]